MSTNSTSNFSQEDVNDMLFDLNVPIISTYILLFVIAFISNIIVIIVVFKDQYMRSVTNYFLVNLAIADLLVTLVCMPSSAWRAYTITHGFGKFTCKISSYMECIAVASSIFTITAMAVDRYLAITKPFGFVYRCFNKRTTIIVIIFLWITSLTLFSPILYVYDLTESLSTPEVQLPPFCIEHWENFFLSRATVGTLWFSFMFIVPGVIMLFAYSMMGRTLCSAMPPFDSNESMSCSQQRNKVIQDRKRVAGILLLLAFVFAVCWLPYHILSLIDDVSKVQPAHSFTNYKQSLLLFGHANSALNPIIYCALSRKFRKSIRNLFCFRIHFSRRRQTKNWQDSSGSATQLHYLHRLKYIPTMQNQINATLSSRLGSQKATKTCAV